MAAHLSAAPASAPLDTSAALGNPKAAVIQMNSGPDRDANLQLAGELLARAAERGAQLALLPENFALMGAKETDKLAIAERDGDGAIQAFLSRTAAALNLWIVAGTVPIQVEGDPARVWPACVVYDAQGQRVMRYDKIHLFDVDVSAAAAGSAPPERYLESASIAAGPAAPAVVDTPIGRLGLSICYDVRFPELYRAQVALGAQVLCVPAAFTWKTGVAHWSVLLRARAIENQCHMLASGQWGVHASGRRTYGHSMIIDPWGEVLDAIEEGDGVALATIDRGERETIRTQFPALQHRRL